MWQNFLKAKLTKRKFARFQLCSMNMTNQFNLLLLHISLSNTYKLKISFLNFVIYLSLQLNLALVKLPKLIQLWEGDI